MASEEKLDIKTGKPKEPEITVYENGVLLLKTHGLKKAKDGIDKVEKDRETLCNIKVVIPCIPVDGYVQVNRALADTFGYAEALGEGFWGMSPPSRLSIKTSLDTEEQVYIGKLAPPSWEGGYIQMSVVPEKPISLTVHGVVKKKFEHSVINLINNAKTKVSSGSIYRGRASRVDMSYIVDIANGHPYDLLSAAPEFIPDLNDPPMLILPRDTEMELHTYIWDLIERPEDFRYNKIPIKSGVLFSGPAGVGKTLAAMHTAKISVNSGFTYFKLETPEFFLQAYDMAQLYAPSVLVIEDVEKIFGGPRTPFMDQVLDRLDGVSSKGAEVITVCTTNFPEKISEYVTRSKRIGREIRFRNLDADAAGRFIQTYTADYLHPDIDVEAIGNMYDGMTPADITDGVDIAKMRAIGIHGKEIKRRLTTELLVVAGEIIRYQKGMKSKMKVSQSEINLRIIQAGFAAMMGNELPADFFHIANEYYRGNRPEKSASGKEVAALPEGGE